MIQKKVQMAETMEASNPIHIYPTRIYITLKQTLSAVTVTEPTPNTTFFVRKVENQNWIFWSHVRGFNQGDFGQVVYRRQLTQNGWHTPSKAKHTDH